MPMFEKPFTEKRINKIDALCQGQKEEGVTNTPCQ
jgi:hypothetical protein